MYRIRYARSKCVRPIYYHWGGGVQFFSLLRGIFYQKTKQYHCRTGRIVPALLAPTILTTDVWHFSYVFETTIFIERLTPNFELDAGFFFLYSTRNNYRCIEKFESYFNFKVIIIKFLLARGISY